MWKFLSSVQQVLSPHRQDEDSYRVTVRLSLINYILKYVFTLTVVIALGACAAHQPYSENLSDRYYIVQPGDNFASIAFLLETTTKQLKRANLWANSGPLQPGTRLLVPRATYGTDPLSVEPSNIEILSADYIWPLKHFEVSSKFGYRRGRLHSGIDLRAPNGTPIHASATGSANARQAASESDARGRDGARC